MGEIAEDMAGCWLDGHFGWLNIGRVIELAMAYGYRPDHPDIDGLLKRFKANESTSPGHRDVWDLNDFADEATDYLTDRAPDGYAFHWECGELFMWSENEI